MPPPRMTTVGLTALFGRSTEHFPMGSARLVGKTVTATSIALSPASIVSETTTGLNENEWSMLRCEQFTLLLHVPFNGPWSGAKLVACVPYSGNICPKKSMPCAPTVIRGGVDNGIGIGGVVMVKRLASSE